MKPFAKFVSLSIVAGFLSASVALAADRAEKLPATDQRAGPPKTLNTLRAFPEIKSKKEWQQRAGEVREQVLISCGLWPLPERSPLHTQISGRGERDGYSVEKVHFQTYPGVYLAGNLYRPVGQGNGPFPGVLNPHGHWKEGRMADTPVGSIAARCINFARQGMVAFSYDMVGYNDTAQFTHQFANHPTNQLWNISLMGLQTWNSLRALDFLESLADVDKSRLACTGESGGGTQTFMLGAIDDRLAAQAPCVMVSHSMQGGCLCENAPGLRVRHSNMELAAAAAPRPQMLVAATGDWTKQTLTVEGPAVASAYRWFGAEAKLRYVRFDYEHNYNQTSREAVYAWFGRWLLRQPDAPARKEIPYVKEPDAALRVWPDKQLPADALTETEFCAWLVKQSQAQLAALRPHDQASLAKFKAALEPAWRHTLQVEFPPQNILSEVIATKDIAGGKMSRLALGRAGRGDRVPATLLTPARAGGKWLAVLAHPLGRAAYVDDAGGAKGLAKALLARGGTVLVVDVFLTGDAANETAAAGRKFFSNYFSTYNRTDAQERAQDLITACAYARGEAKARRVVLCGEGRAGLWAMLAAPAADAVVADGDAADLTGDATWLAGDLFTPGLRKLGGMETAAALATPHPLLVHRAGAGFSTELLRGSYQAAKAEKNLRVETGTLSDADVAAWVAR